MPLPIKTKTMKYPLWFQFAIANFTCIMYLLLYDLFLFLLLYIFLSFFILPLSSPLLSLLCYGKEKKEKKKKKRKKKEKKKKGVRHRNVYSTRPTHSRTNNTWPVLDNRQITNLLLHPRFLAPVKHHDVTSGSDVNTRDLTEPNVRHWPARHFHRSLHTVTHCCLHHLLTSDCLQ